MLWMRHATSTTAIREYPPLEPADATAAVLNVLLLLSGLQQQLRQGLQQPGLLSLEARIAAICNVQAGCRFLLRSAATKLPTAQFKRALDAAMQQVKLALQAHSQGPGTAGALAQNSWAPGQHCALALRSVLTAFQGYHPYAASGVVDRSAAVQSSVAARLLLAAQPLRDLLRVGPTNERSCLTLLGGRASASTVVLGTSWAVALELMRLVACSECDQASQALPAVLEQLSEHMDWFTEVGAYVSQWLDLWAACRRCSACWLRGGGRAADGAAAAAVHAGVPAFASVTHRVPCLTVSAAAGLA